MARRFHTLDGMRGIAALAVAFGHYSTWLTPLPIPHGFLAVDLFFVISGVVIAQVYDPRLLRGMTATTFMLQRYLRLYPLYILGASIGAASGLATWAIGHGTMTLGGLVIAAFTALAMLPSPTWVFDPSILPFNNPAWSLFFEMLANLIFVLLWRYWNTRTLMTIVILSGTALLYEFLANGKGFGGATWLTFAGGFPRVGFSFFLGVLISRNCVGSAKTSNCAWLLVLVLVPILFLESQERPPYVDIVLQLVGLPLLVLIAVRIEPRTLGVMPLMGRVSYPLYAVHMPLSILAWRCLIVLHLTPAALAPLGGILLLAIIVAWAAWLDGHYDQPVRQWLTRRIPGVGPRATINKAEAL